MRVADALAFPKFLAGFFVPSGDAGVLAEGHHDEDIAHDEGALGVSPVRSLGVGVAVAELGLPVRLSGFTIDAKDFPKGAEKIHSIVFHGGDAAGAGVGRFAFGRAFKAPLFLAVGEIEAEKHVLFLFDPVDEVDLIACDGGATKAGFELGGPQDFRARFWKGFDQTGFRRGGVAIGSEELGPVGGVGRREGEGGKEEGLFHHFRETNSLALRVPLRRPQRSRGCR